MHGIKRRASLFNTERIDHLYQDPHEHGRSFILHYGDLTDALEPHPHRCRRCSPTRSTTSAAQSHVAVSLRGARVHRQLRRARRAAPARGDPHPRPGEEDALLPGVDLRAVRPGAGDAAEGDDAVLSALALRRGQALRLLDHGELPRGLRHVRLQRHPLQPRVAAPRRDLRHAQDHARAGAHQARPAGLPLPRQPRRAARLGPCQGLRRGAVADAAAGAARGLRHRHRRAAQRARVRRGGRRASSACRSTGRARARTRSACSSASSAGRRPRPGRPSCASTRATSGPTEVETLLGDATKARSKLGWTPQIALRASSSPRWCAQDLRLAERDALVAAARLHGLRPPRVSAREPRRRGSTSPATAAWSGSAIVRRLRARGLPQPRHPHATPSSTCTDQRGGARVLRAASGPTCVFLAAAKVGGIHANNTYPAEFIHENLAIQTNVIHEA